MAGSPAHQSPHQGPQHPCPAARLSVERVTDHDELDQLGPDLIALYDQVYGRASIVMGGLEDRDFARLSEHFGETLPW